MATIEMIEIYSLLLFRYNLQKEYTSLLDMMHEEIESSNIRWFNG